MESILIAAEENSTSQSCIRLKYRENDEMRSEIWNIKWKNVAWTSQKWDVKIMNRKYEEFSWSLDQLFR